MYPSVSPEEFTFQFNSASPVEGLTVTPTIVGIDGAVWSVKIPPAILLAKSQFGKPLYLIWKLSCSPHTVTS
jgi:hypothetical protein